MLGLLNLFWLGGLFIRVIRFVRAVRIFRNINIIRDIGVIMVAKTVQILEW